MGSFVGEIVKEDVYAVGGVFIKQWNICITDVGIRVPRSTPGSCPDGFDIAGYAP